ncbi:hypothetical protein [Allocoleopsis sp.]|uniref:hypothetical protein n=1 Tax=Allocoleopsis sp. TaxID=3088169 RepID=UPI002FD5C289
MEPLTTGAIALATLFFNKIDRPNADARSSLTLHYRYRNAFAPTSSFTIDGV